MVWEIKVPQLCNCRCCFFSCWRVDASVTSPAITSASFLSDGLKGALCSFTRQNKQNSFSLWIQQLVWMQREKWIIKDDLWWLMPLRSSWWAELNVLFITWNTVRRTMSSLSPVLYLCDSGIFWWNKCVTVCVLIQHKTESGQNYTERNWFMWALCDHPSDLC